MHNVTLSNLQPDFLAVVADPRRLELIVLPTEKCNFRCVYCYEDFAIGRMKPSIVTALNSWIATRASELQSLSISWFGGEPTLALPIIHEVNRKARKALAGSSEPHTHFHSGITTNGYRLDWTTFADLVDVGVVHYQITLDGPSQIHDNRRLRGDGNGTFKQIWRHLRTIADRASEAPEQFLIMLRVHFDRSSAYELGSLVDDICAQLMPSGVFGVQFHEIEPLGGAYDSQLDRPTESEYAVIRDHSKRIAELFGTNGSEVANDVNDYICYAARANSFVVRADGRIGKCTVALNDTRNDVGRLNMDGTVTWFDGRLDPWLRGIPTRDASVLSCPYGSMSTTG